MPKCERPSEVGEAGRTDREYASCIEEHSFGLWPAPQPPFHVSLLSRVKTGFPPICRRCGSSRVTRRRVTRNARPLSWPCRIGGIGEERRYFDRCRKRRDRARNDGAWHARTHERGLGGWCMAAVIRACGHRRHQGQLRRLSALHIGVTAPKGGRHRYVRLTARLAAALREHRSLRSKRVLCMADGSPDAADGAIQGQASRTTSQPAGRGARVASHLLLSSRHVGGTGASHSRACRAQRADHDPTVHAP